MKTIMQIGGGETELRIATVDEAINVNTLIDPGKITQEALDLPIGAEALLIDDALMVFQVAGERDAPNRPGGGLPLSRTAGPMRTW